MCVLLAVLRYLSDYLIWDPKDITTYITVFMSRNVAREKLRQFSMCISFVDLVQYGRLRVVSQVRCGTPLFQTRNTYWLFPVN